MYTNTFEHTLVIREATPRERSWGTDADRFGIVMSASEEHELGPKMRMQSLIASPLQCGKEP